MGFSAQETAELRRMLQAFKADLPPHELGYWKVDIHPTPQTVENESPPNEGRYMWHGQGFSIRGEALCVRCGMRYSIPKIGNFSWRFDDPTGEHAERLIASAKEWVASIAERDGPCWGDVPELHHEYGFVVADSVAAAREP